MAIISLTILLRPSWFLWPYWETAVSKETKRGTPVFGCSFCWGVNTTFTWSDTYVIICIYLYIYTHIITCMYIYRWIFIAHCRESDGILSAQYHDPWDSNEDFSFGSWESNGRLLVSIVWHFHHIGRLSISSIVSWLGWWTNHSDSTYYHYRAVFLWFLHNQSWTFDVKGEDDGYFPTQCANYSLETLQ